ncbi:MAG: type IV pilin protein [Pseudomonadota bacterium]
MKASNSRGFTLLELMICLAIIALLVSLAVPGYQHYRDRAERNDARIGLLRLAADQQNHFLEHGTYASDLIALGSTTPSAVTGNGRYRLAVLSADTDGFVVRASLITPERERNRCAWFEMDQRQHRWAGPAGARECWYR